MQPKLFKVTITELGEYENIEGTQEYYYMSLTMNNVRNKLHMDFDAQFNSDHEGNKYYKYGSSRHFYIEELNIEIL